MMIHMIHQYLVCFLDNLMNQMDPPNPFRPKNRCRRLLWLQQHRGVGLPKVDAQLEPRRRSQGCGRSLPEVGPLGFLGDFWIEKLWKTMGKKMETMLIPPCSINFWDVEVLTILYHSISYYTIPTWPTRMMSKGQPSGPYRLVVFLCATVGCMFYLKSKYKTSSQGAKLNRFGGKKQFTAWILHVFLTVQRSVTALIGCVSMPGKMVWMPDMRDPWKARMCIDCGGRILRQWYVNDHSKMVQETMD